MLYAAPEEIDLGARLWTVPAEHMKGGVEHPVPLSDRCLEILRSPHVGVPLRRAFECPKCGRAHDLLFPSATWRPLSDMTFTKVLRRMGIADRTTVHGFRSSFRDWAGETHQCREVVAEACLAHKIKDQTVAAYLCTTYLEERTTVLRSWAAHCS